MIELVEKHCEVLIGFRCGRSLEDCRVEPMLRSGFGIVVIGICLVLAGCAKELTPYGRARQADTIEAYEEFIRTNPRDPRVRYARQRVESLRLLEAQRSGSMNVPGAEKMGSQETVTTRARPGDTLQGPWNLTTELP
ncbi:MAG: hypothetical protein AMJ65_12875, partial [Phycisphaerae bacterium SG8_4]